MERSCDFKIYAFSVLVYIGSVSAPDEATLKEDAHAIRCTTAGPYNAIPTDLLRVGSVCGLGADILGIHTLSLAARYRTASNSVTLANGMAKIQAAREHDLASIYARSSEWKEKLLNPSVALNTVEANKIVVRLLDHNGKLDDSLHGKKQKAGRQTSVFSCLQNSWASQSLSHCTDYASMKQHHVLLALGWLLVSCASSAMVFARRKDFTLRERHRRVELDFRTNLTLSLTLQRMSFAVQLFCLSLETSYCATKEAIFSTT